MMTAQRIQQLIDNLTEGAPTPEVVRQRWDDLIARNQQSAAHIYQLVAAYPLADDDRDDDGNPTAQGLKKIARAIRPLLTDAEKQLVIDVALSRRQ